MRPACTFSAHLRVLQQRAADGDQVEVAALQHREQPIERRWFRGFTTVGGDKLAGEPDRADGDRGLAGQLLGPTGEVEVGAVELGFPEPALGAMEGVCAGVGERSEPRRQRGGRRRDLGLEVLLLPLREPNDHWKRGSDRAAHRFQDLGREAGPLADRWPAIQVVAFVGALPEELVDQVAVGAVKLDRIEPEALGARGGRSERVDGVGNVRVAHALAELVAWPRKAGGAVIGAWGRPVLAARADAPDVPQLRRHQAAGGVHPLDHGFPPGQRLVAVETRNVGVVQRSGPGHAGAFGYDQPDAGGRASRIVGGHVGGRDPARRLRPRHRRHHDAVGQL